MTARLVSFAEAKARFVHRFTMEYIPAWSQVRRADGSYYAPQFKTDREWYEHTIFPGEAGIHPRQKHCETSGQTWPLGQSLSEPFSRNARQFGARYS